ncbi:hypothetical protein BMIN10S_03008 [Bosea minatitlanensis]
MGLLTLIVVALSAVPAGIGLIAISFRFNNRFGSALAYLGAALSMGGMLLTVLIGAAGYGK